jgi:hypothetical protein
MPFHLATISLPSVARFTAGERQHSTDAVKEPSQ